MLKRSSFRGFTLTELLITMSLLAVLVALGAPSLGLYLQNAKVGSAASIYFAGVQLARTEAIRRNVTTEFVLTDTPVTTANLSNVLVPSAVGRNWVVRARQNPAAFLPAIESKAGSEGDNSTAGNGAQLQGAATAPAVFDGRIAFNGLGVAVDPAGVVPNVAYTIDVTNPTGGLCVIAGGPIRCRQIVASGGRLALCDPAAAAGDSRAC